MNPIQNEGKSGCVLSSRFFGAEKFWFLYVIAYQSLKGNNVKAVNLEKSPAVMIFY